MKETFMTRSRVPPGPKGLPFVGNALLMLRNAPLDYTIRCAREYGDVVRLRFGSLTFYLLVHPDAIEYVLRGNHRNFMKDKGSHMLTGLVGQGLLTSEGDFWRRQRRLSQPAFQLDQIQKYSASMVAAAERALQDWRPGQTRDIHADMSRLTLDIIGQTLFSSSVAGVADTVGAALEVVMKYYASLAIWFPWFQRLPLPVNRRFRKAVAQLDQIIYDTIHQRRKSGVDCGDLLSRLLAAQDEDGSTMTDRQLRDELITLFLAGHETTALALSFTFYLLAQHPEVDAKLSAELEDVLGGRLPTYGDIARLRYTEWVIKESMRLYPPAYSIGREALADCEIAGYHIPKGTQIALFQWIVHRDPRWFEDPETFRPERWDNDLARRIPRCAYFPFGDGPRICIGNQFAMMEAVLCLATIAQRFRLSLAPGFQLRLLPSVTLRPRHGVSMVLHDRHAAGTHAEQQTAPERAAISAK
jgi:cytochrome P450